MGRRPVILVSIAMDDPWGDYWARVFTRPLLAAGALPLILPGLDDAASRAIALEQADGVLLGGGWDIDPHRYGEARSDLLWDLDPRRDEIELGLVGEAMGRGLPIVGTCRGMQVINVALGGSLYLDASLHPGAEDHLSAGREGFQELVELELADDGRVPGPAKHRVAFAQGSALHDLYGDHASLNSFHHQHVRDLGAGVHATGHSDDGVVEAIEVPAARGLVIGVQWEMQEGWRTDRRHFALFERFVQAARDAVPRVAP
ncbi:MAG: putative glutamine amidotransferase [Baekduia sp.]|jgi:putative glutamine amidotransferase|nr:peptidase [Conexibacter sp.]MDX6715029.1 putative glutamine amidotransferase [Baekduia sp.]MDX6731245.1 putative glutamine amidotransferase [Baekduia sp.]